MPRILTFEEFKSAKSEPKPTIVLTGVLGKDGTLDTPRSRADEFGVLVVLSRRYFRQDAERFGAALVLALSNLDDPSPLVYRAKIEE